ncbi:MAG TPA: sulfatase-like hydrolase/transferase [Candidatus Hydrogenedentes bacterium]|nr:sulfatase-like hydrolase/transferase [Candidatus Hydrogenedentota bacterium]HPG68560.1 sulfatase-like hydrolase/transferase [Candidatus Hydrogenedentota bacterium]
MAAKPNVVWVLFDALRAKSLSCYGYSRDTSRNIDALAPRGVLFEQHFAQAYWTRVSVPSYMSGRYFPISCDRFPTAVDVYRSPASDEYLLP